MTTEDRARLQTLIDQWRSEAERHGTYGDTYRIGQSWGMKQCADELSALLLAEDGPHPDQAEGGR